QYWGGIRAGPEREGLGDGSLSASNLTTTLARGPPAPRSSDATRRARHLGYLHHPGFGSAVAARRTETAHRWGRSDRGRPKSRAAPGTSSRREPRASRR